MSVSFQVRFASYRIEKTFFIANHNNLKCFTNSDKSHFQMAKIYTITVMCIFEFWGKNKNTLNTQMH